MTKLKLFVQQKPHTTIAPKPKPIFGVTTSNCPFITVLSVATITQPNTTEFKPKSFKNALDNAPSWQIENARAAFMDELYTIRGNGDGLYTGLYHDFKQHASESLRDLWIANYIIEHYH